MTFLNQRCDSAVIAEVTSNDGHIYQMPWKINPIMLIYNERFFEEIGYYQPPATYSEYLDAAKKFQADTDGDGYIDRWIGHRDVIVTWWQRFFDFYPLYLAASGGSKLIDNGRVVFNNKYAIQALKFLRLLYQKNYFSKEMLEARQDVFLSGVIATRFVGPWEIVHAEKFRTAAFRYNFSRLPVPDDHQGEAFTYGDPKNIVIFNTCKHPQRAWEFIKFMVSKEMDLEFLKMATQLPRRKDLLQDEDFKSYFMAHPKMMPFAKQAKYVRGTDACAQLKEIFDIISQEYEACVIFDVKTPEQAMEDAARAAQVILQ
jgi:multiple sugar transport system substrate-binding protein